MAFVRRSGDGGAAELESAVLDRPLPFLFGPGGGFRRVRRYTDPFPSLLLDLLGPVGTEDDDDHQMIYD